MAEEIVDIISGYVFDHSEVLTWTLIQENVELGLNKYMRDPDDSDTIVVIINPTILDDSIEIDVDEVVEWKHPASEDHIIIPRRIHELNPDLWE